MWNFLLISFVVIALKYSPIMGTRLPCEELGGFLVCLEDSGNAIINRFSDGDSLILPLDGIRSFGPEVFKDLELSVLHIGANDSTTCTPSSVKIAPESFELLGSVKTVILKCMEFEDIGNAFIYQNLLETLILARNGFTEFPQLLCSDIPKLSKLTVRQQKIDAISADSFSGISGELKSLRLDSNELETIGERSFETFSHLKCLNLANNNLKELVPDVFTGLGELSRLNLEGNHLETLPDGMLNDLPSLKSLKLGGNAIRTVNENTFRSLGYVKLSLGFSEDILIAPNSFNGIYLKELRFNADELKFVRAEAFSGLFTFSLIIERNNTIELEPNLFKGLKAESVYFYEDNMGEIDRGHWGLERRVPIYSKNEFATERTQYSI